MLARHAESLFWAGRQIERAESTARMLDVTYHGLLEAMPWEAQRSWMDLLKVLWLDRPFAELDTAVRASAVSEFLVFDPENPGSIVSEVGLARENARAARELISSELWEAVNSFHLELRARNLRADARGELRSRKGVDAFTATEVADADKPPIIDAYLARWGSQVKGQFAKLPDPAQHPVFRLDA